MMITFSSGRIKTKAVESGFNIAGVTRAKPSPYLDAYFRWIEDGMHGSMSYLARPDRQVRRQDLDVVLPGVKSMILVGMDYRYVNVPTQLLEDPSRGRFASYAWNLDYHDVMSERLEELAEWLRVEWKLNASHKVYVDTGAILERSHAQQAGLGFIGKNTMLIHPRQGSYFFIGEILTDIEFDLYDVPYRATMCGSCTRCLNACPTAAFPEPYVLDARRCISYLTIEHKGWIDWELRPLMGNWVFGCDICQDVCPWQRFVVQAAEPAFHPVNFDRAAAPLLDLLTIDAGSFRARYQDSPILRIKRERLVRNACIAAGNWGSEEAVPALTTLLHDVSPLIRGHAAWALGQIQGEAAHPMLAALYEAEEDSAVRDELAKLLN